MGNTAAAGVGLGPPVYRWRRSRHGVTYTLHVLWAAASAICNVNCPDLVSYFDLYLNYQLVVEDKEVLTPVHHVIPAALLLLLLLMSICASSLLAVNTADLAHHYHLLVL